jgi:hypothetical protein
MEVYLHTFLTAATGGGGYALSRPREKSPRVPIGLREGLEALEKSVLLMLKIEPDYSVVEDVAHHCTDRAVILTQCCLNMSIKVKLSV